MLTAVLTLCDHVSGCPSGDVDQSLARIRAPISPPPASHVGLVGSTLIIDNPAVKTRGTISRRIGLTAPFVQGNKSAIQKAKYSLRANVVRSCPNNRHAAT